MKITWNTPETTVNGLCADILNQPHLLIAGATGSGKSVLINSIIYNALADSPAKVKLILIDPKRVELVKYRQLPHCARYASEPEDMLQTLIDCIELMESRYKAMQKRGEVKSKAAHVFIIVDEFADLMTTQKRETLPHLCRLAQLGRAANVHLILATQRPTRDIINGQIKVNMDARIALRCPTAQDSQNIIGCKGAEALPRYGYGYYSTPDGLRVVQIPMVAPEAIASRCQFWQKQNRWKYRLVKKFM